MKHLLLFLALCAPSFAANGFLYPVTQPIKLYTDTNGTPLSNGYIYFGAANQNPITNPVTIYWDAAGTIPAAQPIRTVSGYITRQGTPANIYALGDFSITVQNSQGAMIFNSPTSVDLQLAQSIAGGTTAAAIPLADPGNYYVTKNVEAAFQTLGPLLAQMVTALAGTVPTGSMTPYVGSTAPSGYVLADGLTIGNASSGGTERANADTSALYVLLWNTSNTSPTLLPIQDSTGTPTTRGASASNDFAANKRLPLPDMRGRVLAGLDNLGGTAANRITIAGAGFDGTTVFNAGGAQTATLTSAQIPSHNHTLTDPGHTHTFTGIAHTHTGSYPQTSISYGSSGSSTFTYNGSPSNSGSTTAGGTNASNTTGITLAATGGGGAHSSTQPTLMSTIIIKL